MSRAPTIAIHISLPRLNVTKSRSKTIFYKLYLTEGTLISRASKMLRSLKISGNISAYALEDLYLFLHLLETWWLGEFSLLIHVSFHLHKSSLESSPTQQTPCSPLFTSGGEDMWTHQTQYPLLSINSNNATLLCNSQCTNVLPFHPPPPPPNKKPCTKP